MLLFSNSQSSEYLKELFSSEIELKHIFSARDACPHSCFFPTGMTLPSPDLLR